MTSVVFSYAIVNRLLYLQKQHENIDYQYVGVSHTGVQFIRRERITNELKTMEKYL